MSQPRKRPVPGRPVALAVALNAALGLSLGGAAEARAWLRDGGWARLDGWIAAHRGDLNADEAQPEITTTKETSA